MAFRALHAHRGAVFAHLPDLGLRAGVGSGVEGEATRTDHLCHERQHPMHAK